MKRVIILGLIAASAVFFYIIVDLESMSSAILSMSAEAVFILLILLFTNEIVKGLRWGFFLRSSGLEISYFDALTSYLAAQAGTALPGGSLIGARLAQEHGNVKMRQATASLLGQTFADAFALSLMATIAIVATSQRNIQLFIPLVTLVIALFATQVVRNENLAARLRSYISRWELTRRRLPQAEDLRQHTVVLMRVRALAGGSMFSVGATILSTAILTVLAVSLTERGLHPFEALYAHSFSTVARVLIPVPGGYGVSDGSLTGLLNYLGIGLARATFVALAYRTVIMVFRTIFGLLVLVARYPHLLVGQLRIPAQRPAIVPVMVRERTVIPVGYPLSTGHNAEPTGSRHATGFQVEAGEGDAASEAIEEAADDSKQTAGRVDDEATGEEVADDSKQAAGRVDDEATGEEAADDSEETAGRVDDEATGEVAVDDSKQTAGRVDDEATGEDAADDSNQTAGRAEDRATGKDATVDTAEPVHRVKDDPAAEADNKPARATPDPSAAKGQAVNARNEPPNDANEVQPPAEDWSKRGTGDEAKPGERDRRARRDEGGSHEDGGERSS